MDRLDRSQAQAYWKAADARTGTIDDGEDPDALGNVCHTGAPQWFNEYYARHQRTVFETLLAECPPSRPARAVDVGCGAGRWCRLLAAHGYDVQGIDLQAGLIERTRQRYPTMQFHSVPIQEFTPDEPFDLVTTVTVIQHLPLDEQRRALAKIASILKPGGHVLSLENVADQGAHVWANSIDGWTRAFADVGLERVALRRYDYSPATRMSTALVNVTARAARAMGFMKRQDGAGAPRAPTAVGMEEGGVVRRAVRAAGWASRRIAVSFDDAIEDFLIRKGLNLPTVHCGFLFRKPGPAA